MAEYIEREAVIGKLNKLCDRVCQYSKAQRKYMCGACPLGDAFTVIEDDIPAADVAPMVRGKWTKKNDDVCYWFECSVCGQRPPWNEWGTEWQSPFCPNCGADMR